MLRPNQATERQKTVQKKKRIEISLKLECDLNERNGSNAEKSIPKSLHCDMRRRHGGLEICIQRAEDAGRCKCSSKKLPSSTDCSTSSLTFRERLKYVTNEHMVTKRPVHIRIKCAKHNTALAFLSIPQSNFHCIAHAYSISRKVLASDVSKKSENSSF